MLIDDILDFIGLSSGEDGNLNVLLFDEKKAAEKKEKNMQYFDLDYERDGSKDLIEDNLMIGASDLRENAPIPEGAPKFRREEGVVGAYCINNGKIMTGFFLDNYVQEPLLYDTEALEAFKKWFEGVVTSWLTLNGVGYKVKRNKAGEYFLKIIGDVKREIKTTT